MKYIIFGHKRHGKDTACEILQEKFGLRYAASSEFACEKFLFEQLRASHGYETVQDCFEDRHNHRALWFNAIRDYNRSDLARLGKEIFAENDIYCGIRNKEEFDALRKEGFFDLAIWIDASERLPPEDASSMTLTRADADIVIDNNDSLEAFEARLKRVFQCFPIAPRNAAKISP